MNEVNIIGKVKEQPFHSKSVTKFKIETDMGFNPKTHSEKKAVVPCTAFRLSDEQKQLLFEGCPVAVKGYVSENNYQKNGEWIQQTSVYVNPESLRIP